MEKILFITNRDVLTTCGAFRLIGNRAEALYREYGLATDFCVIQKESRLLSPKRENINAGGEMKVVTYNSFNIISALIRFHKEIYRMINKSQYKAIIVSEISLIINLKKIKSLSGVPIYFDGHGSSEDIYECARQRGAIQFFLRYCAYILDIKLLKHYFKIANGSFVVSSGMRDYYQQKTNAPASFQYFRVPCATASVLDNTCYLSYRQEYRQYFSLLDDCIAFVYSGGIESWQCVEETVKIYKHIAKSISKNSKFFIFTYEVDKARQMIGEDNEDVIVISFKSSELIKALCAMDFAFLIRKDTITNNVAFPNKFLEYVNTRLKIITTPYVYDVASQVKDNNLGCIIGLNDNLDDLIDYIENNHNTQISSLIVEHVIIDNGFKVRLSEFNKAINKG